MNLPNLQSENILLRALVLEDANNDYPNWLNDNKVTKFNSHGEHLYTKEMAIEYIESVTNSKTHHVFAIIYEGLHVGNISLQNIEKTQAEFAILIGKPSVYGKGIGSIAGKLILNYAFNTLDLKQVYCGTSIHNIAMQKLAKKLSFKHHKIKKDAMLKNDKRVDVIEYLICIEDFKS